MGAAEAGAEESDPVATSLGPGFLPHFLRHPLPLINLLPFRIFCPLTPSQMHTCHPPSPNHGPIFCIPDLVLKQKVLLVLLFFLERYLFVRLLLVFDFSTVHLQPMWDLLPRLVRGLLFFISPHVQGQVHTWPVWKSCPSQWNQFN